MHVIHSQSTGYPFTNTGYIFTEFRLSIHEYTLSIHEYKLSIYEYKLSIPRIRVLLLQRVESLSDRIKVVRSNIKRCIWSNLKRNLLLVPMSSLEGGMFWMRLDAAHSVLYE